MVVVEVLLVEPLVQQDQETHLQLVLLKEIQEEQEQVQMHQILYLIEEQVVAVVLLKLEDHIVDHLLEKVEMVQQLLYLVHLQLMLVVVEEIKDQEHLHQVDLVVEVMVGQMVQPIQVAVPEVVQLCRS